VLNVGLCLVLQLGLLLHTCNQIHSWWLHQLELALLPFTRTCCAGEMSGVKSAVVYAGMRYAADALAAQLGRAGITAASYHAGLDYNTRERVQVRDALRPGCQCLLLGKARSIDTCKSWHDWLSW
jgi:hypothetical protein